MALSLGACRQNFRSFCSVFGYIQRCCSKDSKSFKKEASPELEDNVRPSSNQGKSSTTSRTGVGLDSKGRLRPDGSPALPKVEQFIPITRRSLVRRLMQDESILPASFPDKFESLANALNFSISQHMHHVLDEMKHLYDPVDPDKDTVATRKEYKAERLEQEFFILRHLGRVLGKANFQRLPQSVVHEALMDHHIGEGVRVSVNPNDYDTLQVWVRGKVPIEREEPIYSDFEQVRKLRSVLSYIQYRWNVRSSKEMYRRVVLLTRLSKTSKLLIKVFKDVPCHRLETLLPRASITMSKFDRYLLIGSLSIGVVTGAIRSFSYLADINMSWTSAAFIVVLVGIARSVAAYKNKRNAYMVKLTHMLYHKNVANNRGALTLLADRASDEIFKECLLAYSFLLVPSQDALPGLTRDELRTAVEKWLFQQVNQKLQFDVEGSLDALLRLGLLQERRVDNRLVVTPLSDAVRLLPSHIASQVSLETVMGATDGELEDGLTN